MRYILLFLMSFLFMSEAYSDYERRDPFEDASIEARIKVFAAQDKSGAKITFKSINGEKFGLAHAQRGKELWLNVDALFSEKTRLRLLAQLKGFVKTIRFDDQNFHIKMNEDFLYEIKDIKGGVQVVLKHPQKAFEVIEVKKESSEESSGPMVEAQKKAVQKVKVPLVQLHESSRNVSLQFLWPKNVTVSAVNVQDTIVITVSEPITDAMAIESLIRRVPTFISSVRVFYDTFELQLAPGKRAHSQQVKNGLLIQMNDVFKGVLEELIDERVHLEGGTPEIREARFRGEALLAARRPLESRQRFKQVIQDTPDNVGAIRYLAQVEEQLGRWRQALALYDTVLQMDDSPFDVKAKARLLQEYGHMIMQTTRYQKVEAQDRQLRNTTKGRLAFMTGLDIEAEIEHRLAEIDELLRVDGSNGRFKGNAVRFTGVVGYDHERRFRTELGLHASRGGLGAYLSEAYDWEKSRTTLAANFHKPSWNFVQGIAQGGTVDDISLMHRHAFHGRFNVMGMVGFNRYNFKSRTNVASSFRYGAEANYTFNTPSPIFYNSLNPEVYVGYRMDGEYRLSRKQGLDAFAQTFDLLPLVDMREVHTVSARVSSQLPGYFRGDVMGGYSYDRYGSRGWLASGRLYYEPTPTVQAGIAAGREPSLTRGGAGNVVLYGEGFLKLRF